MNTLVRCIVISFCTVVFFPSLLVADVELEQTLPLVCDHSGAPGDSVSFNFSVYNAGSEDGLVFPWVVLCNYDLVHFYEIYPSPLEFISVPSGEDTQIEFSVILPDNEGVYFANISLLSAFTDERMLSTSNHYTTISIGTADVDNDGMLDVWEDYFFLNTFFDDSDNDSDNDGLTNIKEYGYGTLPWNWDSDYDGLSDYFEIAFDGTGTSYNVYTDLCPLHYDTDFDGLSDFAEVALDHDPSSYNPVSDTNPFVKDTDNDGLSDAAEVTNIYQTNEEQINIFYLGSQRDSSMASNANNYLVAWYDTVQDGSEAGVFARFYDFNGNTIGTEFQINTYTLYYQYMPEIASDGINYLVVWQSYFQDGDGLGIFGQLLNSEGTKIGDEFQVNTYTTSDQWLPSIASNGTSYLVAWQSENQDGSGKGIYGQLYDTAASPISTEFQINTYTTNRQGEPAVASNGTNYMVVWDSEDEDSSGIFANFIDQNGNKSGAEFQVNFYTTGFQQNPYVASDGENYFIAWESQGQDGDLYGIMGRIYDSSGNLLTPEFRINTYTTDGQHNPSITSNGSIYLVTWKSIGQDGDQDGVFARFYDRMGQPIGDEFQVNDYFFSVQGLPVVAAGGNSFFVTWSSYFQDGSWAGVFGKFFKNTNPLSIDTDTDGMNDKDEIDIGMDPSNAESLFAVTGISLEDLSMTPYLGWFIKVTWGVSTVVTKAYKIFWKDDFSSEWNQIDYSGWESDIIDNGDGTKSWIDYELDSGMSAGTNTKSRVYKITVE